MKNITKYLFLLVFLMISNLLSQDNSQKLGLDLIEAVLNNNINKSKQLISSGADIDLQNERGRTSLSISSGNGYTKIVKLLLENGASPNVQDKEGWTPLMEASGDGHEDVVKLLLKYGANVNIQSNVGDTALMLAVLMEYREIVSLLLEHGAEVDIKNNKGESALSIANENSCIDILNAIKS